MVVAAPVAPANGSGARQAMRYSAPPRTGPIDLVLRRDGSRLILVDGGIEVLSQELDRTSEICIGGPDREDTSLTVDYAFGPIPVPIDYHPGALGPKTDNLLSIQGATFAKESHAITGAHSGVITLDDVTIAYSNLTPINDTTPAVNYTFNALPSAAIPINIVTGPVVAGFQTIQINDGGTMTFETTNIANKTHVTINEPNNFADTYTLNYPTAATGLTTLTVNGGTAAGIVVNVQATPAAVTTNFVGGEDATVNVGNAGSVQGILGPVNIESPPALNTIVVDDSADSTGRMVVLSSFTPNPADSEGNNDQWGKIAGLAPADINYEDEDTTALTLLGGSGGNTFDVLSTSDSATTIIDGGSGADTFNISANGIGSRLPNSFNGQGGNDTFTVTGSLIPGLVLNIDGGAPVAPACPGDSLSVQSPIVRSGPGSGSVPGVVTSFTSIESGSGLPCSFGPVPEVSSSGLIVLVVLLSAAALFGLRRRGAGDVTSPG